MDSYTLQLYDTFLQNWSPFRDTDSLDAYLFADTDGDAFDLDSGLADIPTATSPHSQPQAQLSSPSSEIVSFGVSKMYFEEHIDLPLNFNLDTPAMKLVRQVWDDQSGDLFQARRADQLCDFMQPVCFTEASKDPVPATEDHRLDDDCEDDCDDLEDDAEDPDEVAQLNEAFRPELEKINLADRREPVAAVPHDTAIHSPLVSTVVPSHPVSFTNTSELDYYQEALYQDIVRLPTTRDNFMETVEDEAEEPHDPAYACGVCGRTFVTKAGLGRHEKSHRGQRETAQLRPYPCETCQKCFPTPKALRSHSLTHLQIKPYPCKHAGCGKAFTTSSNLKVHARTHSGERPLQCPLCPRDFSQPSSLSYHMRTLHLGERHHACSQCGESYPNKAGLQRHVRRTHSYGRVNNVAHHRARTSGSRS
eukprot:GFYU01000780.1.p1 GENE.GFYU01000780.1~~GFYU01000780.1.p1  ORF type:complete len:430 (+),score=40.26 GFYU01000780.1:33-1292(+)